MSLYAKDGRALYVVRSGSLVRVDSAALQPDGPGSDIFSDIFSDTF